MRKKECVAMLLAGGQGSRLGSLTKKLAKPAVPFGGKYRIIDFALSNCRNSGLDTVGVLTQYQPLALNRYIGLGSAWDLDRKDGGVFLLPPHTKELAAEWYRGTADAIYQNINFIEQFNPSYVLVLSGDHIYTMDYALMLEFHKKNRAEGTIAVMEVPWDEASRFGIMNIGDTGRIREFCEKPDQPRSNLASMGIYIFNWKVLKRQLEEDSKEHLSGHDFGKNIIPRMISSAHSLYAYPFTGYWKDVGTVESFWQANMDLLADKPRLDIYNPDWRIYSVNPARPPHYAGVGAKVTCSLVGDGASIYGEVDHSVIFPGVNISAGTVVRNSIVMPYVQIAARVQLERAIIGRRTIVEDGARIGWQLAGDFPEITVVPEHSLIAAGHFYGPAGLIQQKQVV
ncbi:MAG: glucose-1-phosphate adenylyltransferase [Veillonellales bacterium]